MSEKSETKTKKTAKKAVDDCLVEVEYTSKSVKAGQKARICKSVANLLARKGKVIINK